MVNTLACTRPTNNSKSINGAGRTIAKILAITVIKTSPAKMFPNNLSDRDNTLANSLIISINPTAKLIIAVKIGMIGIRKWQGIL